MKNLQALLSFEMIIRSHSGGMLETPFRLQVIHVRQGLLGQNMMVGSLDCSVFDFKSPDRSRNFASFPIIDGRQITLNSISGRRERKAILEALSAHLRAILHTLNPEEAPSETGEISVFGKRDGTIPSWLGMNLHPVFNRRFDCLSHHDHLRLLRSEIIATRLLQGA